MAADGHIEIDTRINAESVGPDLDALKDKIEKAGEGLKTAGENMSTYVSLPLTALGGAAIKMSSDIQASQGKLQAQLGITSEQAKHLTGVATDMWKNGFGESVDDVSNSMKLVMAQMGALDDAELTNATESAYILADAFDADVSETTRAASQLMQQFGVDSTTAFDLITTGYQRGGDYSGEFLDTITEYSTQFANMGFSAEQMMGMFVSGVDSGIWSLDKMGDAVKESFLKITEGSKGTNGALDDLGLKHDQIISDIQQGGEKANGAWMAVMMAISKVKDPAERNALAIQLMGTPLEDLGPQFQAFFAQSGEGMKGFEGSTKKAGDALYDNFGSRLQTLWRTTLESLTPVGDILLKIAEDALPKLSSALTGVVQWFSGLNPAIQKAFVVFGILFAAIGPVLVILGQIATGVSVVVGWFAPLAAAIAEAGGLMAWLGPIFTAITGPIGLIVMAVIGLIAIFVALYKNNADFRNKVLEIWKQIKDGISKALVFVRDNIVKPIMNEVMSFVKSILGKLKAFWDENGKGIIKIVTTAFGLIWSYVKYYMGIIKGVFQIVWPIITGIIKIAWANIKTVFTVALDLILGAVQFFTKLFTGDWKGAFGTVKQVAKDIMADVKGIFKGINLRQIGKDIIQGLIDGLGSMATAIKNKVSSLSKLVPKGMKEFFGINSPSRLMREDIGKWIPAGVAQGIDENSDAVKSAVSRMSNTAIPDISTSKIGSQIAGSLNIKPQVFSQQVIKDQRGLGQNGINVNVYPQKAIIDQKDISREFQRAVMLYG